MILSFVSILLMFQFYHIQDYPILIRNYHSYEDEEWSGEYDDYRDGYYYNYINFGGNKLFKHDFFEAQPFTNGTAPVFQGPDDYILQNCPLYKVNYKILDFGDHRKIVFNLCGNQAKVKGAFIDRSGKFITDYEYDALSSFNEEMAVSGKIDEFSLKLGYIDKNMKLVIPYKFTGAWDFHNGYAKVCLEKSESGLYHECFIIDKTGRQQTRKYYNISDFDGSDYLKVSVKKNEELEHGYVSLSDKWLCRNCSGTGVYQNRSCVVLHGLNAESYSCAKCYIMNERGNFISTYQLRYVEERVIEDLNWIAVKHDSLRSFDLRLLFLKMTFLTDYVNEALLQHLEKKGFFVFDIQQKGIAIECGISKKIPIFPCHHRP